MNQGSSKVRFINPPGDTSPGASIVHRAGWVIITPWQVIENGCVEVENGLIKGVYRASPKKNTMGKNRGQHTIDHGPGVLMPCLVNAHLHLELSALKNALSFDKGFAVWVQELLEKREAAGTAVLVSAAKKAAKQLVEMGVGYIGEISTLGLTRTIVQSLNLSGVWFQEFLGSDPPDTNIGKTRIEKNESLSFSLAGHAPHTTDPLLLQAAKKETIARNLPFSIHLAESDAESKFISGQKGQWGDFLMSRGIDTSSWPIGSKSPVQYLEGLGVLDSSTLAVHLLNIEPRDLDILVRTQTQICLCPRSNNNLHNRLPDIGKMLEKRLAPSLGSDSLASCDSLSIFDEMAFIRRKYPSIDPAQVLSMATINGARALGLLDCAGTLDKGKKSAFIYVDLNVCNKTDLIERVTTHET
jgi:cytosine/adenosine deaminase-related metal-dependent hydrolase